jgi:hypothetical protein
MCFTCAHQARSPIVAWSFSTVLPRRVASPSRRAPDAYDHRQFEHWRLRRDGLAWSAFGRRGPPWPWCSPAWCERRHETFPHAMCSVCRASAAGREHRFTWQTTVDAGRRIIACRRTSLLCLSRRCLQPSRRPSSSAVRSREILPWRHHLVMACHGCRSR